MELVEGILDQTKVYLYYWTGGKPGTPLVVFSHDQIVDHHEWDATLPIVGKDFRIMTWDIRGHGLVWPAPFSLQEAVKNDLLGILDALNVEEATFA